MLWEMPIYGSRVLVATWPLFQFLNPQSVGLLGGGSARRKASTYTQNKITQTFTP
jgi:hypothetical protein